MIVIKALRQEYGLDKLLKVSGLSGSTYYYQCKLLKAKDKYEGLKEKISNIYGQHKGRYGYRMIMTVLRNTGETINHKLVYKLMKTLGLKAVIRQRKHKKQLNDYGQTGKAAPNVLRRNFNVNTPNSKWVTDITQFSLGDKKLYLSR